MDDYAAAGSQPRPTSASLGGDSMHAQLMRHCERGAWASTTNRADALGLLSPAAAYGWGFAFTLP
jgi:hypothetical protein